MRLCVDVYKLSESFPSREEFGLTAQLRRAAVSVPSNIAEGRGRGTWLDFRRFLLHARGSLFELRTQLLLARELRYMPAESVEHLLERSTEVARLINGLIKKLTPTRYLLPATERR